MGRATESLEVLTERREDHAERAAINALLRGSTHQQISWGLACVRDGAYTLTRRAGAALSLTLPGKLCELLGVKAGDRIVYGVTERGGVELFRATVADLPEFARAAAERADRLLAEKLGKRMHKHFEKHCERCENFYCAQSRASRFCPVCRVRRQRAQWREYWHRKGKLTSSYQARLKNSPRAHDVCDTHQGDVVLADSTTLGAHASAAELAHQLPKHKLAIAARAPAPDPRTAERRGGAHTAAGNTLVPTGVSI